MITNDDKIGNYWVQVFAAQNSTMGFQCPTLKDARAEAKKLKQRRDRMKKVTTRIIARKVIGRNLKGLVLAEECIELLK